MRAFITGGAGFIGSNLTARLLKDGAKVTAYDNLSLGRIEFLRPFFKNKKFRFIKGDLLTDRDIANRLKGHDVVFHMQANSDIPRGIADTSLDLKLGTLATHRLMRAVIKARVKKIVFASTSAVYGEALIKPTPESYGPLFPISFYGASKLASETLITAFSHCFGLTTWIFRFSNVAGRNSTHGVIVDLANRLKKRPKHLIVLGDGKQSKPYMYVDDCIDGMLVGFKKAKNQINCFNLTPNGSTSVKMIAELIIKKLVPNIPIRFTGTKRGWPGDVTKVRLSGAKMASLGWKPSLSSDEAVKRAVSELSL